MSDEATKVTGKSNSISHKNGSHKRTYVINVDTTEQNIFVRAAKRSPEEQ